MNNFRNVKVYQKSIPLGHLLNLCNIEGQNGIVMPEYQREQVINNSFINRNKEYVLHLISYALMDYEGEKESELIDGILGSEGLVNTGILSDAVYIAIDPISKVAELPDGAHRMLYFIPDFIKGRTTIKAKDEVTNPSLQKVKKDIFNITKTQELTFETLPKEIQEKILKLRINANVCLSEDPTVRASFFLEANSGKPVSQVDKLRVSYFDCNMWRGIETLAKQLKAAKNGTKRGNGSLYLSLFPNSGKIDKVYTEKQVKMLTSLLWCDVDHLVKFISRTALGTEGYLPNTCKFKKLREDWGKGVVAIIDNFFKATRDFSEDDCRKVIIKLLNNVLTLGKTVYEDDCSLAAGHKGYQSLNTGMLDKKVISRFKTDVNYRESARRMVEFLTYPTSASSQELVQALSANYYQPVERLVGNTKYYTETHQDARKPAAVRRALDCICDSLFVSEEVCVNV